MMNIDRITNTQRNRAICRISQIYKMCNTVHIKWNKFGSVQRTVREGKQFIPLDNRFGDSSDEIDFDKIATNPNLII